MIGTGRLRRLATVIGAVALLVSVAAGVGPAGEAETSRGRSSPAVTAAGVIGTGAGAPDTRVQRGIEVEKGQRGSRHDGVGGPTSRGQHLRVSTGALAGVLERAGHPERVGQILLRGPPSSSA